MTHQQRIVSSLSIETKTCMFILCHFVLFLFPLCHFDFFKCIRFFKVKLLHFGDDYFVDFVKSVVD